MKFGQLGLDGGHMSIDGGGFGYAEKENRRCKDDAGKPHEFRWERNGGHEIWSVVNEK